jgi:Flp pilus assembly pilin Flp
MRFPRELRRTVPPLVQEFADYRVVAFIVTTMAGIWLYGATGLKNGWERYLPPIVGSLGMTLFFLLRPWNPYKSYWARRRGCGESHVENDLAAQRLIRVMRSKGATRVALLAGLGTTAILAAVTLVIGSLRTPPARWTVAIDKILLASFVWACIAGYPIMYFLLRWSIQEWRLEADSSES